MKKLYIHIGLHKTGTTLIQSILKDKTKELKSENIAYIDFDKQADVIRQGKVPDCKEFFENLDKQMPDNYKLLISNEFLCAMGNRALEASLSVDSISQVLHNSTKMFDVKIIVYLRRIDLWLESLYTQDIANGHSFSFDEYIKQNDVYNLDFYKLVSSYSDRFGKDKIIVRLYDKKYLPERNSLLQDFADVINSEVLKNVDVAKYNIANTGFDRVAVEIARRCNAHADKVQRKEIRRILQYAVNKDLFTKNIYFTLKERKKLLEKHSASEEKIKKEFFPDMKESLFPPLENMNPAFDELKLDDAVRILMFAVMAPSPYEHLLTLRSLHILYKIEMSLKRINFIKTLGKKMLTVFGIRDKRS